MRDVGFSEAIRPRGTCYRSVRQRYLWSLLTATALSLPVSGFAQTEWTGATSDEWLDPLNWTFSVPTALLTTYINGAGTNPVIDLGITALTRELFLGSAAGTTGGLTIDTWGGLVSGTSEIGAAVGTDYTVTVTGLGASWDSVGQFSGILVGNAGRGELHILNGADVTSNTSYIGWGTTGDGYVMVDGAGSTWTLTQPSAEILYVGSGGNGEMLVSGGGVVESDAGHIGFGASATGTATITGAGSEWNVDSGLTVASLGQGSLSILNGGQVNSAGSVIGSNSGADGTVLISGTNSAWNVTGLFNIAAFGTPGNPTTGVLTLANGGTLSVNSGTGTVQIAITNNYTSGEINIGAAEGDPAVAPGMLNAARLDLNQGGELVFNHAGTAYDFSAEMAGQVTSVIKHLAGTTNYTGNGSSFLGAVDVSGGTFLVNGNLGVLSISADDVEVFGGGTLGGGGTLWGHVSVADGTLAPGNSPGTLTIGGDLTLTAASMLDFELGSPLGLAGVDSDLINVGGSLTLDGTLNVIDAGGFGAGTYRLFNYDTSNSGGVLIDNGLAIGAVPGGFTAADLAVLTGTVGQVDLLVGGGSTNFAFWDGANMTANNAVDGGNGNWTASATNWTDSGGSANGMYDPASFLVFQGNSGSVFVDDSAGAITVANGMQFATSGYTVFGDELTLSGATTIRVGDGTAASASDVAVIGSNLIGSGSLTKTDFGRLVLSDTNSYTGGTTVTNGTLAGDASSLQGDIVNNAELDFRQTTADGSYAGTLTGSGSTRKFGDYALTFSGNSAAYAGSTSILAGTLFVDGTLGGALSISNGATLGGSGTAGAVMANAGGTLAPGNSIGTLNLGSAVFDAGSIYEVELNDGGTVAGTNNDLLAIAGTATINGGTVHVAPENGTDDGTSYASGAQYTILTAGGGVGGSFSTLTDDYAFLDFLLSYDAGNVYLTAQTTTTTGFCLPDMTPNQCATGDGVFSLGAGNLYTAVLNLPDAEAPAALDLLSGEIHASAKAVLIEDSRFPREAALNRLRLALANPSGAGVANPALWGQAFGSLSNWQSDGNAAGLDRTIGGLFVGGDGLVTDTVRLGAFGGYSHSSFNAADRNSTGSADSWHLGAYGGADMGNLALRFGTAYAWHNFRTARSLAFTGFSDGLSTAYSARTAQVFGEAGYRFDLGDVSLEPFANLAHVHLGTDGFSESGGAAALSGTGTGMSTTFTTLGLRAETEVTLGDTTATLRGMAGWRHAFGDSVPLATHAFSGGDTFTIAGVPIAKDALVLDLDATVNLSPTATLGLSYNAQFGAGFSDHGIQAKLAVKF